MRTQAIIFCCLVLGSFSTFRVSAQKKRISPVLYSITEQDGLSDNGITCFFQDSRGFVWIGTRDGLNRYDGSVIRVFKNSNNNGDEQTNNHINDISEDPHHRMWMGTMNGLNMYDPALDSLYTWKMGNDQDKEASDIKSVLAGGGDYIWLGSANGVHRFDPVTKEYRTYYPNGDKTTRVSRQDNFVVAMLIDRQQRFWVGSFSGLWRFFPVDGHFERYLSGKEMGSLDELVTHLFEDHQGRLWLSVWNEGIKLFDPDTRKILHTYRNPSENTTGITEAKDNQGNYHLYCSPQLNEIDPSKETMISYLPDPRQNQQNFDVNGLYTSRDNLVWLATSAGIRIMDPARQVFHHHFLSDQDISTQGISAIRSGNKMLIGGRSDHFLVSYDSGFVSEKRLFPNFSVTESGRKIQPSLLSMVREDSSNIWLCTEKGLILYNERNGNKKWFQMEYRDNPVRSWNFINTLFIDSRGKHW
ncbi:MAG TPA: two-component regulator propeller domain-containing protein, partial [Puia sp.]|nr:two-component regulator propeller domain-containing protein [Puia sp.]